MNIRITNFTDFIQAESGFGGTSSNLISLESMSGIRLISDRGDGPNNGVQNYSIQVGSNINYPYILGAPSIFNEGGINIISNITDSQFRVKMGEQTQIKFIGAGQKATGSGTNYPEMILASEKGNGDANEYNIVISPNWPAAGSDNDFITKPFIQSGYYGNNPYISLGSGTFNSLSGLTATLYVTNRGASILSDKSDLTDSYAFHQSHPYL